MIYVENVKLKEKTLKKRHPNATIVDVTSKADSFYLPLSPFYPHGNIPIPFSPNEYGESLEGIWQGLKVFNDVDIDISVIKNKTMKNLKRTISKYGYPLGHRKGLKGNEILNYVESRLQIYLPTYKWILENKCQEILNKLRDISISTDLVLLDFATNGNVFISKKPLSHAYLIKYYLDNEYPNSEELHKVFIANPNIEQIELEKEKVNKDLLKVDKKKAKVKSNKSNNQTELF
jgi:hypothetical protein